MSCQVMQHTDTLWSSLSESFSPLPVTVIRSALWNLHKQTPISGSISDIGSWLVCDFFLTCAMVEQSCWILVFRLSCYEENIAEYPVLWKLCDWLVSALCVGQVSQTWERQQPNKCDAATQMTGCQLRLVLFPQYHNCTQWMPELNLRNQIYEEINVVGCILLCFANIFLFFGYFFFYLCNSKKVPDVFV